MTISTNLPLPPFKFRSILKQVPWGGERIIPFKRIQNPMSHVGESWEISDIDGSVSEVQTGEFKGQNLTELSFTYGVRLLGKRVVENNYNGRFPLLIKFIDAQQNLSIQVHPDDAYARKMGVSNGKTEMWYVVDAAKDAYLLSGFSQPCSKDEYVKRVSDNTICDVIARHNVSSGDCFFIPAGQVHAICSGIFLIEIQQRCDITYRIYDYNRLGIDGKLRQLHVQEAGEAIDFESTSGGKTAYGFQENQGCPMVSCPYFTTLRYELTEPRQIQLHTGESFTILIAYQGKFTLGIDALDNMEVEAGESVLIPAEAKQAIVFPATEKCGFLEVHI